MVNVVESNLSRSHAAVALACTAALFMGGAVRAGIKPNPHTVQESVKEKTPHTVQEGIIWHDPLPPRPPVPDNNMAIWIGPGSETLGAPAVSDHMARTLKDAVSAKLAPSVHELPRVVCLESSRVRDPFRAREPGIVWTTHYNVPSPSAVALLLLSLTGAQRRRRRN